MITAGTQRRGAVLLDPGSRELGNSVGLLILRLGAGGFLVTHGWGKLKMLVSGDYTMFGDPLGIGSELTVGLLLIAELIGPLLVTIGLATRVAAVPTVIAMAVAAFVVHAADPWTMEAAAVLFMSGEAASWASKEPALLFLVAFLTLILTGPGRFSIDGSIRARGG